MNAAYLFWVDPGIHRRSEVNIVTRQGNTVTVSSQEGAVSSINSKRSVSSLPGNVE